MIGSLEQSCLKLIPEFDESDDPESRSTSGVCKLLFEHNTTRLPPFHGMAALLDSCLLSAELAHTTIRVDFNRMDVKLLPRELE